MQGDEGGYYSTLDADSEGEEGKFYVWRRDQIDELLGEDVGAFSHVYDVTESGNWEGKNILNNLKAPTRGTVAELAAERGYLERGSRRDARSLATDPVGSTPTRGSGPASMTRCWPTGTG